RPPQPPPFPYTTLFRSQHGRTLARLQSAVQEGSRQSGLQAPDDVDGHLEQRGPRKLSRSEHPEERRRRHEHQQGERPEFPEDPRSEEHTSELQSLAYLV